uniref:Uncharacterized protein n=1 Tax=Myripristis murdjan TaxID=586833 RepID=A0A667YSZ6_9TELE
MSSINVSLDNPYRDVTIPRAKLRPSSVSNGNGDATVIANPLAVDGGYDVTAGGVAGTQSSAPPPYMVKEDVEEERAGSCRACCYRCRRK